MKHHKTNNLSRWIPVILIGSILAIGALCPSAAHAATAGGSGLPWETPIQRIVDSFLGPIAVGMCLIGFVAGVWRFMTGGEMDEIPQKLLQNYFSPKNKKSRRAQKALWDCLIIKLNWYPLLHKFRNALLEVPYGFESYLKEILALPA